MPLTTVFFPFLFSFLDIRKWIADVQSFAESNVNIVLIGNKCDLVDAKVIDTEQGRAVARDFGIEFYEASAKTDHNVQEAFNGLVNQVCERVIAGNGKKKAPGAPGSGTDGGKDKTVDVGAGAGEKKKCCQ